MTKSGVTLKQGKLYVCLMSKTLPIIQRKPLRAQGSWEPTGRHVPLGAVLLYLGRNTTSGGHRFDEFLCEGERIFIRHHHAACKAFIRRAPQ